MKQISKHVYMVTGLRGCNVGLVVAGKGVVMIDTPQKPTEIARLKEDLKGLGEVVYIINTEPHPDHFTGNSFFKAPVVAQEGTRQGIAIFPLQSLIDRTNEMDPEGRPQMEGYRIKPPEITFNERMCLHVDDVTLELVHLPGHTASETAVYIPGDRVVFVGDNVVYKTKAWLHDAVPQEQWLESLRRLRHLDVDLIVPGHGDEACTKEYLPQQEAVVKGWTEAVQSAIARGLNQDQALAAVGNPDPFPLPKGREGMAPMVNKMIVAHLYQLYQK